jgi:hypothetical protein
MEALSLDAEQRAQDSRALVQRATSPAAILAVGLAAILIAAFVYVPWTKAPFDILDFSEFLPFLHNHDSLWGRFEAFVAYYSSRGRFNLLSYLFINLKWSLFGDSAAGWQLARFAEMWVIVVAVFLLLRRFGLDRWGSAFGASLFIVAQTASPAWIRLTMGEPFGFLAVLGALLIAVGYQNTSRWRTSGAMIAALLTAALLAKEMLAALIPFVLLVACTSDGDGGWQRLRMRKRDAWLAAVVGGGSLVVLVSVAVVALRASAGAFVSDYGAGLLSVDHFIHSFGVILLPVSGLFAPRFSGAQLSASLVYCIIVATGVWLSRTDPMLKRRWSPLLIGALALPAVGALIYLPWPYFQDFYGLPFLLGPAVLLAIAVTSIARVRPAWRWAAYAGCLAILCQGAMSAAHASRSAIAARRINVAVVSELAKHPDADSIVVAKRYLASQAWQGLGPTLGRYARAIMPDKQIPALSDATCKATIPMIGQGLGNAILVTYSSQCGAFPVPARTLRYYYTYLDWPTFTPKRDSLVVGILGPAKPE